MTQKKIIKAKSPYIKGSKIPITYFINYVKNGYNISDFLASYPWINRKDLEKKLEEFETNEIASRYAF